MKDFCQYFIKKKSFIISVMLIGISISMLCNFLREDIYESKMTVKIDSAGGAVQVQNIVYDINQKIMLKPISGEDGVLGEDYSAFNVYANDRKKNGWIDIYVHGQTPEEAKSRCEGIYEHIKYYSEHYKKSILEQACNKEYIIAAKNVADEDLKEVLSSKHINLSKDDLYRENDFWRKEYLYRTLLENEIRMLYTKTYDCTIITPPNLPEHPVSKKYLIVITGSLIISVFVAVIILFISFIIKKKESVL